jgi:hypothetical protein
MKKTYGEAQVAWKTDEHIISIEVDMLGRLKWKVSDPLPDGED